MPAERSGLTTSISELEEFLGATRDEVNRVLREWSERTTEVDGNVADAIAYSLAAPGKRLRPALVIGAYRALGGVGDVTEIAAAVEVVHTYSLVHDDLPCMDDDDLRRGRSTTHRKFDVATATDAGFRMLSLSARLLASGVGRLGLSDQVLGKIALELYDAAGATGMIGGQVLDLEAEGQPTTRDMLTDIHRAKTGALIGASACVGALAAEAGPAQVSGVREFGREIGLAFQIVDDVLDATGTSRELGKTAGKDAAQHKASFAAAFGIEAARREAERRVQRAIDHLRAREIDSTLLVSVAQFIVNRRS